MARMCTLGYTSERKKRPTLGRARWGSCPTPSDEFILRFFGPVEDERGPGRPEIGPAFSVRFPPELLDAVDQAAQTTGRSRAQWLRDAAERALV